MEVFCNSYTRLIQKLLNPMAPGLNHTMVAPLIATVAVARRINHLKVIRWVVQVGQVETGSTVLFVTALCGSGFCWLRSQFKRTQPSRYVCQVDQRYVLYVLTLKVGQVSRVT